MSLSLMTGGWLANRRTERKYGLTLCMIPQFGLFCFEVEFASRFLFRDSDEYRRATTLHFGIREKLFPMLASRRISVQYFPVNVVNHNLDEIFARKLLSFVSFQPVCVRLIFAHGIIDRKSTRLNSSHVSESRMPSS